MAKPATSGKRAFGEAIEKDAADFLSQQGLTLVSRNFQCKLGEIDLIMRHRDTLVFVEVRYRKSTAYGSAAATVDHRKQRKLVRTAQFYLVRSGLRDHMPCRFDVLGIGPAAIGTGLQFDWIKSAFTAPD